MSLPGELARGARTTGGRIVLGAMLLFGVAVSILALVPGRVDRATLSDSVASAVTDADASGPGFTGMCARRAAQWRCVLTTTEESDSGITYRVSTSGNCWTATLSNSAGMVGLPTRAKDCIQLVDQLTD